MMRLKYLISEEIKSLGGMRRIRRIIIASCISSTVVVISMSLGLSPATTFSLYLLTLVICLTWAYCPEDDDYGKLIQLTDF